MTSFSNVDAPAVAPSPAARIRVEQSRKSALEVRLKEIDESILLKMLKSDNCSDLRAERVRIIEEVGDIDRFLKVLDQQAVTVERARLHDNLVIAQRATQASLPVIREQTAAVEAAEKSLRAAREKLAATKSESSRIFMAASGAMRAHENHHPEVNTSAAVATFGKESL